MSKKSGAIIIVLGVFVIGLIVSLFLINSKFEEKLSALNIKLADVESHAKNIGDTFGKYKQENQACCTVDLSGCHQLRESSYGKMTGHIVRSSYWDSQEYVVADLCAVTYPDQSIAAWKIHDPVCAKVEVLVDTYNC